MSKAFSYYSIAFLFVCVASWCLAGSTETTYQELRTQLMHQLYERQEGLMNQADYLEFIEPYIQEAEKTLQIPRYLMHSSKMNSSIKQYFDCLLNYNVAYFHSYAKTYKAAQKDVVRYERALQKRIEKIKAENQLADLNVAQELQKTKELFAQANRRFYKKLGIGIRVYNFFRTLGS